MTVLIWLEGIEFSEHVDDSNDLSVIRGSSLALLEAGALGLAWLRTQAGCAAAELIFTGASLALFRVPVDEPCGRDIGRALLDHLAQLNRAPVKAGGAPPMAHLRFVTGVSADTGDAAAIRRAQGLARLAQMTGDYPRRPAVRGSQMCTITRSLVADDQIKLSEGQVQRLTLGTDHAGASAPVSTSAKARRFYGRRAREGFFGRLPATGFDCASLRFTQDLHELVDDQAFNAEERADLGRAGVANRLPMSVRNKLAIFYADGNGFGKIRNALGGDAKALALFSDTVQQLMQKHMLGRLIGELQGRANTPLSEPEAKLRRGSAAVFATNDDPEDDAAFSATERRLRFELLMYGGDELCFVVPSWLGLEFARIFMAAVEGRTVTGTDGQVHALTFKAGLVFAPFKMPIASGRSLAKTLADMSRLDVDGVPVNSLGVQAFESLEPPANGLEPTRAALFGEPGEGSAGEAAKHAARHLPIRGTELADLIDDIMALKAMGFPRSQLYQSLKAAQWSADEPGSITRDRPAALGSTGANRRAHAHLAFTAARSRYLADPATAALNAWLLTHLWDYVDPLGLAATLSSRNQEAA
jgi:hypothetical protein